VALTVNPKPQQHDCDFASKRIYQAGIAAL